MLASTIICLKTLALLASKLYASTKDVAFVVWMATIEKQKTRD